MHTLKNTMNRIKKAYILLTTLETSTTFLLTSNEISKKNKWSVKHAAMRPSNFDCATEILIGIFFKDIYTINIDQKITMQMIVQKTLSSSNIFYQHERNQNRKLFVHLTAKDVKTQH